MAILIEPKELDLWRRSLPASTRLAVTNGCFDIIHAGHLAHLEYGRQLGDILIVGINDDEGVRALKGIGRPINALPDRLRMLCALVSVDYVTWFSGVRATQFLRDARPTVYFKGGDYSGRLDPEEQSVLEACGAGISILPRHGQYSTTSIIERLLSAKV